MAKNKRKLTGIKRELNSIEKRISRRAIGKRGPAIIISFASLTADYVPNVIDRPLREWETFISCTTGVIMLDPREEFELRKRRKTVANTEKIPTDIFINWIEYAKQESDKIGQNYGTTKRKTENCTAIADFSPNNI